MRKGIKKIAKSSLAALLCFTALQAQAEAPDDMPLIMTLKTNIFSYQGPSNSFTIYLGATEKDSEFYIETGSAEEFIYVSPWSLGTDEDGDNSAIATPVYLNVTENNDEVRIYGDAGLIDYIDVHGCYVYSVELAVEFPNLMVIDLSHNELSEIDLSPQTSLASIDLSDNAFTQGEKMVIGTNHPGLMILSVGINDACDPDLDLTNFPQLQYFSARNNYGLREVDTSKCPYLVSLVLEVTNISSIDVSQNKYLDVLNLSQTRINSIDISQNTRLGEFYLNHEGSFNNSPEYKLTEIDLSNNPLIQYLDLGGNRLSSIDLSNNNDIRMLYLQRNLLEEIDLSGKNKLSTVNLSNNLLNFATLPIPQEGWDYYYYRSPLDCDLKYKVGEPIDFSAEVIRAPFTDAAGNTITPETYAIVFAVPAAREQYELDPDAYTFADGIITFNQAVADSVYVQFFCDIFPDWTLNTDNFMVKTADQFDEPSKAFSFTSAVADLGKTIAFNLGAAPMKSQYTYPTDVTISYGGEKFILKDVVAGAGLNQIANVSFTLPSVASEVTVSLNDGYALSALEISGISLQSIDLTGCEGLEILSLHDCGLSSVNLAYNRALRYLDLSGNNLASLDLAGIRGDYEKYSLSTINLADNRLNSLSTVYAASIQNLNLSGNNFREFDLKYFTGLRSLDLSANKLEGTVDISAITNPVNLNFSSNAISAFQYSPEALTGLSSLDLSANKLSFASLPVLDTDKVDYHYAPQAKIEILGMAPSINLSAQNITAGGYATLYQWKYTDSNKNVEADKYRLDEGATIFDSSLAGLSLYCEMTNPLFPEFDDNPLTTTPVTVSLKPENLVASFVTSEDGEAQIGFRFHKSGDNAVYIDWRGDGSEYEPYLYPANGSSPSIYRTGTTFAGAEVKVYSYESPENISVFALNNTPLASADLSPLAKVEAIDIHNAGLADGKIKMPESGLLWELVLDGNNFSTEDFSGFPEISSLNLAGNQYSSFDLSPYPSLSFAILANNRISEVKFGDGQYIIQLDLSYNNLSKIDLSGVEGIQELLLANNSLSQIDLSDIAGELRALNIAGNNFTFATLPTLDDLGNAINTYYYSGQKPLVVECIDGKIDLSSQAEVEGVQTEYLWFLGDFQSDVYYDYEMEMFVGEELEGPEVSDNPEYTIKNGITTFHEVQKRSVICAMTNSYFPNLILYTAPAKVNESGVKEVLGYNKSEVVDVYLLNGVKIRQNISLQEALNGLNPGIYIINGRKVMVK